MYATVWQTELSIGMFCMSYRRQNVELLQISIEYFRCKRAWQYPNDVNNDAMPDYINSNYIMEMEKKPYSCLIYNFLGLTAKKIQVR